MKPITPSDLIIVIAMIVILSVVIGRWWEGKPTFGLIWVALITGGPLLVGWFLRKCNTMHDECESSNSNE